MILMLGKSMYRDDDASVAPSIGAAATAAEDSGAAEIVTSGSLSGGGGTEPSSMGIITMSSPPEPAPASGANAA
jgi:hypothetical protein